MLWLALHLPELPLEIFTRGIAAAESLVVTEGRGRDERVRHVTAPARRAGIAPGLALDAALALNHRLHVRVRDERAEQTALAGLAQWAMQFTSFAHLAEPCAVLLEIQGSLRLFGGVAPLCRAIEQGVMALGWNASLAVAPTPLGASWLARTTSGRRITEMKSLTGALFPLPLSSLDLTESQQQILHGIGVRTLGECLRLPRDGFARRLGKETVALFDRALGLIPDPRAPYVPPEHYEGRLALPAPVDNVEALTFALHRLLIELAGFLTARGVGIQRAGIGLRHADRTVSELLLELVSPTRDVQHLLNLLREQLARTPLKAPVEEVSLTSRVLRPLADRNTDFFVRSREEPESRAALIEHLVARLGPQAVQGVRVVAEHRPEYAWRYVAPGAAPGQGVARRRPLWLLASPTLLEIRDEAPWLDGHLSLQPDRERIESGWWDGYDVQRDYFIARDARGMQLWVFRELTGERRWFVHGVFG